MLLASLKIVIEVLAALVACIATGTLFDRVNWPLFHSWGLMHGSIFLLFPIYFIPLHAVGKKLEGLLRNGSSACPMRFSYLRDNWRTFRALVFGVGGFMIPFTSVGGVILGIKARNQSLQGSNSTDKGLATASIVLSALSIAYQIYVILIVFYAAFLYSPTSGPNH